MLDVQIVMPHCVAMTTWGSVFKMHTLASLMHDTRYLACANLIN